MKASHTTHFGLRLCGLLLMTCCLIQSQASARHGFFHGCGVLEEVDGCLLFKAGAGGNRYFALDTYGEFQAGDTVFVNGRKDFNCDSGCTAADGCLHNRSISRRPGRHMGRQIVVRHAPGGNVEPIIHDFRGTIVDSIALERTFLSEFPDTVSIESVLITLQDDPDVTYAQPNYEVGLPEVFQVSQSFPDEDRPVHLLGETPDPYYGDGGGYTINCDSANLFSTGEGVVVAVIDNGIAMEHPLFENALAGSGYDLLDHDTIPEEEPGVLYGHGTFVAGIIKRIAPDCKILPIRVFDSEGFAGSFLIADAIYLAISDSVKADVINMSFGTYEDNDIIRRAIDAARDSGVALVAAPGNDASPMVSFPSGYPGVISVAALDSLEYLADFSNFGPHIDVCAPGVLVYSALAGEYEWGYWSGTSFSAPMVAGACALIRSERPLMPTVAIENMIRATAETRLLSMTIRPPDFHYGYGRVDALRAMLSLHCGDTDNSGEVDLRDALLLIDYVYHDGPPPQPIERTGDVNQSGDVDFYDVQILMDYLYHAGPGCHCR